MRQWDDLAKKTNMPIIDLEKIKTKAITVLAAELR